MEQEKNQKEVLTKEQNKFIKPKKNKKLSWKRWLNFGISALLIISTISFVSVYFSLKKNHKNNYDEIFNNLKFSIGDMNESLDGTGPNKQKIKHFKESNYASKFTDDKYNNNYWTNMFIPKKDNGTLLSNQDLMRQQFILVDSNNKPFLHYAYEYLEKDSIEFTSFSNDKKGILILRLKANTKETEKISFIENGVQKQIERKVPVENYYVIEGFKKQENDEININWNVLLFNKYNRFLRPNDKGEWVKNKEELVEKINKLPDEERKKELKDLIEQEFPNNLKSNNILFKNLKIENDQIYVVADYDVVKKIYDIKLLNNKPILDEKEEKKSFKDKELLLNKCHFESNNNFLTIKSNFKDSEDIDKELYPSDIKKELLVSNKLLSPDSKIYLTGNTSSFNIAFLEDTYSADDQNGILKFSVLLTDEKNNIKWEYRFEDKTRFKSKREEKFKSDVAKMKISIKNEFKPILEKYTWEQILSNKDVNDKKIFITSDKDNDALEKINWDINLMLDILIENPNEPKKYIKYENLNVDFEIIGFDSTNNKPKYDSTTKKLSIKIKGDLKNNTKRTIITDWIAISE
ncbi:hypothetical protein [Mycoplasma elephantis]|uniref:hypothetical protein n=1 Tax=Mycoplasma elephantis TaxID=114882 RepID=UPI000489007A|nr:hypothetical protein [Mycoplasma elephantis]